MDLGQDAFTITYTPSKVTVTMIVAKSRGLGYRPEEALKKEPEGTAKTKPSQAIPEPVASALAKARKAEQLLLIDFYADWCGSCKELEEKILTDPEVRRVLEGYRMLKVDTDKYVDLSERFEVLALPTLLVLDEKGRERYRHVGIIDAETLAQKLMLLVAGDGG